MSRGKQSRPAEYDRPTAFAMLGPDGHNFRCQQRYRFRAIPQRNSLVKLIPALRVNSGTGEQKRAESGPRAASFKVEHLVA
jgi:hypothetical protein